MRSRLRSAAGALLFGATVLVSVAVAGTAQANSPAPPPPPPSVGSAPEGTKIEGFLMSYRGASAMYFMYATLESNARQLVLGQKSMVDYTLTLTNRGNGPTSSASYSMKISSAVGKLDESSVRSAPKKTGPDHYFKFTDGDIHDQTIFFGGPIKAGESYTLKYSVVYDGSDNDEGVVSELCTAADPFRMPFSDDEPKDGYPYFDVPDQLLIPAGESCGIHTVAKPRLPDPILPDIVTPLAPAVITARSCGEEPAVELPVVRGVVYDEQRDGRSVSVRATVSPGFELAKGSSAEWQLKLPEVESCPEPAPVVAAEIKPVVPAAAELPRTGGELNLAVPIVGGVLLAAGLAIAVVSRRKRDQRL